MDRGELNELIINGVYLVGRRADFFGSAAAFGHKWFVGGGSPVVGPRRRRLCLKKMKKFACGAYLASN